ncbi:MAG TPA: hypothetical protein PKH10_00060 [bacterium]|nr:hypothetical protein [bacterium]
MKRIVFLAFMVFAFSGILFAQEISLDEAVKYLEENGYEYEIAYDEAVKELPEGAVVFTPFMVEATKEAAEEALSGGYAALDSTTIQQDWVFGDIWYPQYYRLMMVGVYSVSPIGDLVSYKFMWARNTTSNPLAPVWSNITGSNVCTITAQRYGTLSNCSCSSGEGAYVCTTTTFGEELLNYYSGSSACYQCDHSPYVFSVRFSVNPQSLTWSYNPILKIWIPIYLYLGWVHILSDGDGGEFSPVWDLCETNLYNFCD